MKAEALSKVRTGAAAEALGALFDEMDAQRLADFGEPTDTRWRCRMNIRSHSNEVNALIGAAKKIGAVLPDNWVKQVEHMQQLAAEQRTAARAQIAIVENDLLQHLGEPAEMRRAKKKAVDEVARGDADSQLSRMLVDRCASMLSGQMRKQREIITAAFGKALAEPLDILSSEAGRLPEGFSADQADQLSAELFTAWTKARDAQAVIESVRSALNPLYGGVRPDNLLGIEALATLRYVLPPELDDVAATHRFISALAGERSGGRPLGPVAVLRVFPPAAVIHRGGVIEWATPIEHERRVAAI